jgi:hypothetical protein
LQNFIYYAEPASTKDLAKFQFCGCDCAIELDGP